jgi:penicillin-binding protein 1A
MKNILLRLWHWSLGLSLLFFLIGVVFLCLEMSFFLPSSQAIKDVHLQLPLKIFSRDGELMAEYGEKRRIPISYAKIPKALLYAVLATEDQHFFEHNGVDIVGLMRAGVMLIVTGHKSQGGSTITMQVARNFYLTRRKTYSRKFREIMLAIKIDYVLTKPKILELYFNKIFLGKRAYGFAAASQVYYGKPLNELTLSQYAMLAGLPKSPSTKNPIYNPKAAKKRRNHVLRRMLKMHNILRVDYEKAIEEPVSASYHHVKATLNAPYVTEVVRKELVDYYGPEVLTKGWKVYTTVDSVMQREAENAVRHGVLRYDQRHGYRGSQQNLGPYFPEELNGWIKLLKNIGSKGGLPVVAILKVTEKGAKAVLMDGKFITIPWRNMAWARPRIDRNYMGTVPHKPSDVLQEGDVVRVEKGRRGWRLSQMPEAQGAFVALDPKDGAVIALRGGFDYSISHFNRIMQASRQSGSSFKPFVYSAALEKGYSLASILQDTPIVMSTSGQQNEWRPENDNHTFAGPIRLRVALRESRNLASIRLLRSIGVKYAINYAGRFGFNPDKLPQGLSLVLGSASIRPIQLAVGYAVFANGGYRVEPHLVDRIIGRSGRVIFQSHALVACSPEKCDPSIPRAHRVISYENAFLMTEILKDAIQHGTGRAALRLGRSDLAGKTGTTNEQVDAWFAGYNTKMVGVAWMGYDIPRSLREYGSQAALPIWMAFMRHALKNMPEEVLVPPKDIVQMSIDKATGGFVDEGTEGALKEYFRYDHLPKRKGAGLSSASATAALYED